jgi:hypothetical protein
MSPGWKLFRPIWVSNVILKLVIKVTNHKTIVVVDKVVAPVQTYLQKVGLF